MDWAYLQLLVETHPILFLVALGLLGWIGAFVWFITKLRAEDDE